MQSIFDEKYWIEKIKEPLWYLEFSSVQKKLGELHDINRSKYEEEKNKIYRFFADALENNLIYLGNGGKNFDSERKAVDTAVIHHTSGNNELKMTSSVLSAIHLLRLYVPNYANPKYKEDEEISHKPIWSGHFNEKGRQVFYAYHWIIHPDGSFERLLKDSETGWHAGNWEINCKSVGIVLEGNFEKSVPSQKIIDALNKLIKEFYPNIKKDKIFGHCEINPKTMCPSELFLDREEKIGWKNLINPI